MRFESTPLSGVFVIHLDKRGDERGFFARVFCKEEFAKQGLVTGFVQVKNSRSAEVGTLRGMHYQLGEHAETKVVRCIGGVLYDQVLDIRPESETFGESFGLELSAENRTMLYVPKGFAHGFLTLSEGAEILYFVDAFYSPEFERGIRWNDPRFGLEWPMEPKVVSERDQGHPDFDEAYHLAVS